MGKISIEIDITADELVQVIGSLAVKTNSKPQKHKAPVAVKVKGKNAAVIRGQRWTKQEEAWLRNYIKTNAINKKIVRAFNRVFDSKRTFSSLANKGYEFRKKEA